MTHEDAQALNKAIYYIGNVVAVLGVGVIAELALVAVILVLLLSSRRSKG